MSGLFTNLSKFIKRVGNIFAFASPYSDSFLSIVANANNEVETTNNNIKAGILFYGNGGVDYSGNGSVITDNLEVMEASIVAAFDLSTGTPNSSQLLFDTRSGFVSGTRFAIRGNGQVIVGNNVSNSTDLFQVNGSANIASTLKLPSSGNSNGLVFGNQSTTGFNLNCIFDYWGVLKLNASNGLFSINNNANISFFQAFNSGRVSIGITNSSDDGVNTLQVSGSIAVKSFDDNNIFSINQNSLAPSGRSLTFGNQGFTTNSTGVFGRNSRPLDTAILEAVNLSSNNTPAREVLSCIASANQSGNIQSWRNSTGTVLTAITPTGKLNINTADSARNYALAVTNNTILTANPTGSIRNTNIDPFFYLSNLALTQPVYGANIKCELGTNANTASSSSSMVVAANIYSLISNAGSGTFTVANNVGANIMADVGGNLPGVTITNNIGLRVESVASKGTTTITNAYGAYITRPNHGVNRYGLFLEAPTGGTGQNWSLLSQGRVNISDATSSVSATTGALIVSGGIGVGGNIYASGFLSVNGIICNSDFISTSGFIRSNGTITGASFSTNGSVTANSILGVDSVGVNANGSNLIFRPGNGAGNSNPASIIFQTSNSGTSGSTAQSITEKMRLSGGGNLLIGTTTDDATSKLQVNGNIVATQFRLSANNVAPVSSGDTGTLGECRLCSDGIYYAIGTNNWRRILWTTF